MQITNSIWQNGKFIPWEDAKIHVLTHTLHYGGGAFEGIRFYKTDKGSAIFCLDKHIDRLFYSSQALGMQLPYSKDEIISVIKQLILKNNLEEGYVRPLAYYGHGKMGVNPIGNPVDLVIACWPWGTYLPCENVDVKISNYIRIHSDSTIVDAKLCGHYVNGILASLELRGTHYHEALFLDSDGYITEGVGENFFIVKDNIIYTPKLGSILAGITRDTIIQLAKQLKFEVIETGILLDDALNADEAFFTGTAAEVTAIRSINDKVLSNGEVGLVTSLIKKTYLDLVKGKNEYLLSCLTYVAA